MIHQKSFETISEMVEGMTTAYMQGEHELITDVHFYRSYTKPIFIEVAYPTADLDFKFFAQDDTRWKKFCKAYLGNGFFQWMEKLPHIRKSAELGCSFTTKSNHKLGNCIVGISFRISPEPTLTLLSRASYIIPTASLELSMIGILADRLGEQFGQVKFNWLSAQMQFSAIYGFPYIQSYWLPRHKWEFEQYVDWAQTHNPAELSSTVTKYLKYVEKFNDGTGKAMSYQRVARVYQKTERLLAGEYPSFTPDLFYKSSTEEWL